MKNENAIKKHRFECLNSFTTFYYLFFIVWSSDRGFSYLGAQTNHKPTSCFLLIDKRQQTQNDEELV